MEAISSFETGENCHGLSRDRHDGGQLAPLKKIERGRLVKVYGLHLNAQGLEHRAAGVVGPASLNVEAHLFTFELPEVSDVTPCNHMQLIIEEPRDIRDV